MPNGTIVQVNRTLLDWLDYPEEELVLKKKFQDILSMGGKIFYETHHAPLANMQGYVNELSYELISKRSGTIPVLAHIRSVKDAEGNILGYKNTFFNITERKKFERELVLARKKAEQAASAKSDFLSTISHEIRTPLNAIIGLTHILKENNKDPECEEYLRILQFSSNNLLGLINDVLDLSKIESGKVSLVEKDFHLKLLLKSLVETFKIRCAEKKIELKLAMDERIPEALIGDALKLSQVFTNLLGNAVKFTEKGSITLEAKLKHTLEDRVSISFAVKDTGIGISSDKLEAIFEEFTQANSQISIKYGGTGLGLSISQKIIELHGAKMGVESQLGKGSTFHFTLHLKVGDKSNIVQAQETDRSETRKLSGAKVLLCEDNAVNVLVVSKFLKDWDIEFDVATDGNMALFMVQNTYYDLVLMDIRMPVLNGYEATKRIRELEGERYKHLPIIAMTASADSPTQEGLASSLLNDFISKPFEPSDFYNKLVKHTPLNFLTGRSFERMNKSKGEEVGTLSIRFDKFREMAEGDLDFLKGLAQESLLSFEEHRERFKRALQNEELSQLMDQEHKITLVLDLLDAQNLRLLIQSSIKALESGEFTKVKPPLLRKMDKEFDNIITELSVFLSTLQA